MLHLAIDCVSTTMLMFTILSVFLVCAHGAVLPPVPMLDGRIVGGFPATINEAPYQVALILGSRLDCGGSIISRTAVLTAAHCAVKAPASQWKIRAGSTYHNTGGQLVGVSRLIIHSRYNTRYDNDISIMYLSSQLILGPTVVIVTLPPQGKTVADGAPAFVTGWGLSDGGSFPTQLRKLTIPILNQQRCVNAYVKYNPVTSNMICAGNINNGGQDACQGDSGGPLTVGRELIGITSWGEGCALPGLPGVYTRVPNYRTWIQSNI